MFQKCYEVSSGANFGVRSRKCPQSLNTHDAKLISLLRDCIIDFIEFNVRVSLFTGLQETIATLSDTNGDNFEVPPKKSLEAS